MEEYTLVTLPEDTAKNLTVLIDAKDRIQDYSHLSLHTRPLPGLINLMATARAYG